MGRDEHNTSKRKQKLAQTPKQELSDSADVEFANEWADDEFDKRAQKEREQAQQHAKKRRYFDFI